MHGGAWQCTAGRCVSHVPTKRRDERGSVGTDDQRALSARCPAVHAAAPQVSSRDHMTASLTSSKNQQEEVAMIFDLKMFMIAATSFAISACAQDASSERAVERDNLQALTGATDLAAQRAAQLAMLPPD